jgi:hypothetical protein
MKKFLVLILTLISLFTFCNLAMAQIYAVEDGYARDNISYSTDTWHNTDTWYSVDPQVPYVEVYYNDKNANSSKFGIEGYNNEQTFFDIQSTGSGSSLTYLAGSYLLDSGIFLGGSYYDNSHDTFTHIDPGYRFSLDDFSFIAVSCDYLTTTVNSIEDGIKDYNLYYKYYIDKQIKLSGEYNIPKDGNNWWWMGANIKAADDLVIGGYYNSIDNIGHYHAGFTYAPAPLIVDAEIGKDKYDDYYTVSGMLMTADTFRIGADYFKYDYNENGAIHLKINFGDDKTSFIVKYRLKNDDYSSAITAAFKTSFK